MVIDYNKGVVSYMNQANYTEKRVHPQGEINNDPSETIPGETLTIKEIMARALNGVGPATSNVEFFDQIELDNIQSFPTDLTDLDASRQELIDIQASIDEAIAERDAIPPETPQDPQPNVNNSTDDPQ